MRNIILKVVIEFWKREKIVLKLIPLYIVHVSSRYYCCSVWYLFSSSQKTSSLKLVLVVISLYSDWSFSRALMNKSLNCLSIRHTYVQHSQIIELAETIYHFDTQCWCQWRVFFRFSCTFSSSFPLPYWIEIMWTGCNPPHNFKFKWQFFSLLSFLWNYVSSSCFFWIRRDHVESNKFNIHNIF